ncbi:MAG: hypothetical protein V3V00_09500 [Saprospiraceae bacterium]
MNTALSLRQNEIPVTAIIAPQSLTEEDIDFHELRSDFAYWSSNGWKSGSNSRNESSNPRDFRIPSFEILDTLSTCSIKFP